MEELGKKEKREFSRLYIPFAAPPTGPGRGGVDAVYADMRMDKTVMITGASHRKFRCEFIIIIIITYSPPKHRTRSASGHDGVDDEHEKDENADDGGGGDGDAGLAAARYSDLAAGESEEAGRVGEAKAVLLLERRGFGQGLLPVPVLVLLLFPLLLLLRMPPRCRSSV